MQKTIFSLILLFNIGNTLLAGGNSDKNTVKYKITAVKAEEDSILSESNIAEVKAPLSLYIPNAFTPNGDGLNDSFGIVSEGVEEFELSIFNKWGALIFETTSIEEQWNGTYGSEAVPDGVYVYNLKIKTADEHYLMKSGNITVIK